MSVPTSTEILRQFYGTDDLSEYTDKYIKDFRKPNLPLERLVSMKFPYQAPGNFSPPLPTVKDIENARDTSVAGPLDNFRFCKVFDTYAVKMSGGPDIFQV